MILNFKGASLNLFTLAAAIAVIFFLTGTSRNRQMKKEFGIVIDGGSTGTRIHVFEYLMERGMPVVEFGKGGSATSLKVSPGLSDFADDPDSAGNSIMELIQFGKERVPKKLWDKTEIRLMATAGLRRLAVTVRERILESCRRVLRSSGFQFRDNWASVIPGIGFEFYRLLKRKNLQSVKT